MTIHAILAFCVFAFVSSISPGPNNLMLLSSGVNFGFRRSLPLMFGIFIGFYILLMSVGLGIGQLITRLPWAFELLKWCGASYLLYLAWAIAGATSIQSHDNQPHNKPMTFLGTALFQWVNPKAWIMAISAFTLYAPKQSNLEMVVLTATIYIAICIPCIGIWVTFGVGLRRFLTEKRNLKLFNYTMALLLVASLYPLIR